MNRGSSIPPRISESDPLTSMRPRFMNRGSGTLSSPSAGQTSYFNEAPIHESGKSSRTVRPENLDVALQ